MTTPNPPLRMTPNRLAILRAVADGHVTHYRSWGHRLADEDRVWVPLGEHRERAVTKTCADLEGAGLIKLGSLGRSFYSPRQWELTDAGRTVLAAAGVQP